MVALIKSNRLLCASAGLVILTATLVLVGRSGVLTSSKQRDGRASRSSTAGEALAAPGSDWPRYRGPEGSGVSADTKPPTTWSEKENLRWRVELPGPGSSSPIVSQGRVFVTCYSGYGLDRQNPGRMEDLERHLICVDRDSGEIAWSQSVAAELPEDAYAGQLTEHGYATNTPVVDGDRIYVFFGKTGVLAFDLEGKKLWQTNVGKQSGNRRWGSAASLILHKDLVIVNAAEEARAIIALNKETGEEAWRAKADGLESCYGTPLVLKVADDREDLVIAAPYEVWGLNPDLGKLRWYAEVPLPGNVCASVVAQEGVIYATGGFPQTSAVAIRAGGNDDVSKTHVLWTSSAGSYVASPVLHNGHLYWVNDQAVATCVNAKTGEQVYGERLPARGRGKPFYSSVVLADGKLFAVSRYNGTFVLSAKPEFEQLAVNVFESDESDFNASPAVSGGQMFLRSDRYLYCVAQS